MASSELTNKRFERYDTDLWNDMTWASSFSFEVVPMFYNLTETKQLPVIDEGFLSDSFFLRNMLASLFDLMFNSVT